MKSKNLARLTRNWFSTALLMLGLLMAHCDGNTATADLLNGDFANSLSDTTPPNILSPIDASTTGLTVVLAWTSKSGAATYTIDVATDSSFTNIIPGSPFTVDAPSTTYTLTLTEGNSYYWRVRADTTEADLYGNASFNALDNIVYVYCPAGTTCDDTGAIGHVANPFQTIAGGLAEADRLGKSEVRVAARDTSGTPYEEVIVLREAVNLFGGYSSDFTSRNTTTYSTVVASSSDFVVFAQNIFRTTQVDGFVFINTADGYQTTYGVKTDNCSNALLLNNVSINGGTGNSSYGMYNINSSHPLVADSSITTGDSSVSATGIYNDSTSSPSLTMVTVTTGTAPVTNITETTSLSDTTHPNILSPSDGSTQGLSVTLQWTAKSGAAQYFIEWSTSYDFVPLAGSDVVNAPATSYLLTLFDGNTYYWRVRADTTTTGQYGQGSFTALDSIIYVYCPSTVAVCDNTGTMGTKSNPFATISRGISTALAQSKTEVRVASRGTAGAYTAYEETLVIKDGVNVTGGYDDLFLVKDPSVNLTKVASTGNFVAYAADIFQPTLIEGLQFENISTGLTASYGVKTDNCSSGLQFNNVIIDGGQGAYAYGMYNTNLSEPSITQSTIQTKMTATTSSASVGIYNDSTSKPTLNLTLVQTGPSNGYTIGILNVQNSNSSVILNNSKVSPGNAVSFSAGIAGGLNLISNTVTIDHSEIKSGNVSGSVTDSIALYIQSGSITDSLIIPGTATYQYSIRSDDFLTKNMILTGNILTAPASIYTESNQNTFQMQNNTFAFSGNSAGLSVGGMVEPSELRIDNNIVYNTGSSAGTGFRTDVALTTIDYNLETNIPNLLKYNNTSYYQTCSATDTIGTGTFGSIPAGLTGINFINNKSNNNLAIEYLTDVFVDSSGGIYVGSGLGLFVSTDNGASWKNYKMADGLGMDWVNSIFVAGTGTNTNIYVATDGGLSRSIDNGVNWTTYKSAVNALGSDIIRDVFVMGTGSSTNIFAATANGLSVSQDNGVSWTTYNNPDIASNVVTSVYASGTKIFAATYNGLSISNDNGATWTQYFSGKLINDVYYDGINIYVAGGSFWESTACGGMGCEVGGFLSISNDGGATWIQKYSDENFTKLAVFDNNIYVAMGYWYDELSYTDHWGGLLNSPDMGATWSNLLYDTVYSVFVTSSKIYAIKFYNLLVSSDNGILWKYPGKGINGGVNNVFITGQNIFAGTNEGLSVSNDEGNSWLNYTNLHGLANNHVNDVFAVDRGTLIDIYAGTNNGLSVTTDNGLSWLNYTTANGLADNYISTIWVEPGATAGTDILFVGTNNGLSISYDSGTSWNTIMAGVWINDIYISGSSVYVATLSGLYVSADLGLSWAIYSTSNGLPSNDIKSVSLNGIKIIVSTNNGLSYSEDEGNSWVTMDNSSLIWDVHIQEPYFFKVKETFGQRYLSFSVDGGLTFTDYYDTEINQIEVIGNKIFASTNAGLTIGTMQDCHNLLPSPAATGNRTATLISGDPGSGAVFGPNYDVLNPNTWTILGDGPADLDASGGWSVGDIGADAANVGPTSTPGATW
jgi:hypothetical protein